LVKACSAQKHCAAAANNALSSFWSALPKHLFAKLSLQLVLQKKHTHLFLATIPIAVGARSNFCMLCE
jgi:hypothetical protein